MRRMLLSLTVIGALVLGVGAMAASASTGYSLFGDAQIVSPGNGSANAVEAAIATADQYGGVDFSFPAGLTLAGVNHLSTDLKASAGTCSTGTPRFAVGVDDGTATTKYVFFYPTCSSAWASSGNLASSTSLVDAMQLDGGAGYNEPYGIVQAAHGTDPVTAIFLVADASNGVQTVQFDNSQVNDATYSYEPNCTPTGFYRDGINLTAAQIGGDVTGTLDATGCNIGVYYDGTVPGNVTGATIFGANYYGVLVNAAAVNVTNSTIRDIGEAPFNGSQHGVGVLYTTVDQAGTVTGPSATGTLSGNTISRYQKNGVVISGSGAAMVVDNNTVTGLGPVDYIAQNGIQISFGATAKVTRNTVTGNDYTPSKVTACGLLIYKAGGVSASKNGVSSLKADNNIHDNETDICNFGKGGGFDAAG
jgi:hypothetical protein